MSSSEEYDELESEEELEQQDTEREYAYSFKLLFCGDMHVGKSSLILRLSDDYQGGFSETVLPTVGVDVIQAEMWARNVDKLVLLHLWDNSGNEKLRLMSSSYYRGAHCLLFVYDCCMRSSFESIRSKWLVEASDNAAKLCHGCLKVLVANKCDDSERRCVSAEEAQLFALENGMRYVETSAKEDAQGLLETLTGLTGALLDRFHPSSSTHTVCARRPAPCVDRSSKTAQRGAAPAVSRNTKPRPVTSASERAPGGGRGCGGGGAAAPAVPPRGASASRAPPVVRRDTKPGGLRASGPPPVSRASKPVRRK